MDLDHEGRPRATPQTSTDVTAEDLAELRFFVDLPAWALGRLAAAATRRRFEQGAIVVRQNANHLAGPREVVRLPVSHTDRPEEKLWDRFEAYWLRLVTGGVHPDFGASGEPSL